MNQRIGAVVATFALVCGCAAGESAGGFAGASQGGPDGAAGSESDGAGGASGDTGVGAEAAGGSNGDAAADSGADATTDSGADATMDSGADATMDATSDVGMDSGGDAAPDAPGDGKQEASLDAPMDAVSDEAQASDAADADSAVIQDVTADDGQAGGGEVWVEIDYTGAYTPESPQWSFSPTPGWGAAQWAQPPKTWPEAWDRWNNMVVETDPIGKSLTIGSSSELQLMIGLEELLSYTSISVRLEGRSKATSSSVNFDVYNPLNNCGSSGTMSQDWTVHVVDLDLGSCAVVGAGVQAIRVSPTNGTLALVRMRVTLHGAQW